MEDNEKIVKKLNQNVIAPNKQKIFSFPLILLHKQEYQFQKRGQL